jgi:hypothetical protein
MQPHCEYFSNNKEEKWGEREKEIENEKCLSLMCASKLDR